MNKSTASLVAYAVPMIILMISIPWNATSAAEFGPRFELVAVLAVAIHFALRYGLRWLPEAPMKSHEPQPAAPRDDTSRALRSTLWRSLKAACAASIAIVLTSIVLGKSHLLAGQAIFLFGALCQQLIFVGIGIYILSRQTDATEVFLRVLSLTALAGMAIFFAWSSNVTLQAQNPPVPPYSSNAENMWYALPAVAVAVWGIGRTIWRARARG
jgi:hypothetical protein